MKLLTGLVSAALAGLTIAATPETADVYLFGTDIPSSGDAHPRMPKEIARHILLRRTSRDRYGSALGDIPNTIDEETAISHINKFGKSRAPLFGATTDEVEPAQLVVVLEGITAENARPLREALAKTQQQPAFFVSDPPSSAANRLLIRDFHAAGVSSQEGCTLASAVNPNDDSCWQSASVVVAFDVRKAPGTIDTLVSNLNRLALFVSNGEVEAALVLLPESSRSTGASSWAAKPSGPSDLRRRDSAETVLSDSSSSSETTRPASSPAGAGPFPFAQDEPGSRIPQCFQSQNSCDARTKGCSGHGACVDKYASDPRTKLVCFACQCQRQILPPGEGRPGNKTIFWGGNMCQKKDISSPFWLIAGFTVTIVGVLSFAISLLFNVGEETLPGVIGAGVSRAK
ncbi:hypothetical protein QBC33DRAFT_545807 [Phialemonium atrogriseum]|uniref:Vacuolar sorting protein Vps3844 C-terminal domain-containing protein n=1 Tax=Phialemonium atrogriseum TaxID=1093897 RepID=A0AAJ0FL44_9PEZI|nr:uncharacterized protein QBC33DRAFT_545807 [Phialemonium atrogriseum]KAK1764730.1 hypothetical protein QBC33DRAFT_545807 [Phialemonium atrogriseum]